MSSSFDYSRIPDHILHDAVKEVLGSEGLVGGVGNTPYNFRCPICGDSKTNKNKKRGYVLFSEGNWSYVCHNECGKMSFLSFLKNHHPHVYRRVIFHAFDRKAKKAKPIDTRTQAEKTYKAGDAYKFKPGELVSIFDTHPTAQQGLAYCLKRRIPQSVYSKWYVCLKNDKFYDRDSNGKLVYNDRGLPKGNEYNNRLIIPYYRYGGTWVQFDARSLDENSLLKYRNLEGVDREMYNIDWLDVTKPFYLLEGAIDSCFIKNAVAFGGTKHLQKFLEQYPHIKENAHNGTVIWDNDNAGYDEMPNTVRMGFGWFNWSSFDPTVIKDINNLVLKSDEVKLDADGFIDINSIKKYIMSADGGIVKLTMLYGNREKMRMRKVKKNFDMMSANKTKKQTRPYF